MKSLVAGVLVTGLGLLILVVYAAYGGAQGAGDFRTGPFPALAFGSLLLVVGVFYAVRGLKDMRPPAKGKRRKRKETRRK
jgi:hypothetical protein